MMERDSVVAISDKHDPTERAAKALQGTPETVANSKTLASGTGHVDHTVHGENVYALENDDIGS